MTLETRAGLLEVANRYRVPVVEDDVYSRTYFGGYPMPSSLYALDQHSQVINVSTFSTMLAPGFAVWVADGTALRGETACADQDAVNLFTCGLNQLVLADVVSGDHLDQHLEALRPHHCALRDVAVTALEPSLRQGLLRCGIPSGGLYLWCKVLPSIDMEEFFAALEKHGVSVAPGAAFEPERTAKASAHFRLCFTAVSGDRLEKGIQILNQTLESFCKAMPLIPS